MPAVPSPTAAGALLPAALDLVVPTVGYFALHAAGMSDVWALTLAGSATAVVAVVHTVQRRQVDALGLLVAAELALSVALAAATDDRGW